MTTENTPKRLNSTPGADGFFMPAEWAPHAGTWVLWPEREDNWRRGARPAQQAFSRLIRAIADHEPVTLGVSAQAYERANAIFLHYPQVRVLEISTDDAWVRDTGPTMVVNTAGDRRGIDWQFNAWGGLGGLYFPWDLDDQVAQKLLAVDQLPRYRADFVLEGGAVHVDGEGTAVTTEECLLNPNRNPGLNKIEIEQKLKDYLGVNKVLWIPRGIYLDETDAHVDNMACFIRPGELVLAWTDDENDPQYERSAEALAYLEHQTDAKGRTLVVHKLPLPAPMHRTSSESLDFESPADAQPRLVGERLAGSYVNFYLCNGALIMPAFDDPHDSLAANILAGLFPDREIVQIPGREILLGGGNIHCVTQQLPA